jgi:S1-C subfamily serine protease
MTADISGEAEELQSVRIKRMKLGSHAMIDVPMSIGTGNSLSSLALGFLSRFNITFDFPNRAIYLKKNKNFDRPYRSISGGIAFARDDAGVVVDGVREGSPAAAAGITIKDIVLKVGDQDASGARLFNLYDEFAIPGRTVHVRLLRDGEIIEADVKLPEDEEKDSVAGHDNRVRAK